MIHSAVLIQYTHVTDTGQTDGIGVVYTHYSIYAVARKNGYWYTFTEVIAKLKGPFWTTLVCWCLRTYFILTLISTPCGIY